MMHRSVCVLVALLTLLVLTLGPPTGQACPRSCNCYQANEVHCTFRSLLNIPPGLPAHTRRINLGFNSINRIHNSSLAGLKKAELLMLHSNDLHHLPDAVFRDMTSLQILKLSYNKLREISTSLTFSGLTSLLRLYLDHNLLQHIHPRALLQLPGLRLLRLQGNRLHQLHPHTLCTLSLLNTYYFSTLRHLDLSNNSLTTLPRETVSTAPLLESLALHDNPWSCDCMMNWILTWTRANSGLMKCPSGSHCPICGSPDSLQGQGSLKQSALPCTSPVIHSAGRDTPLETEVGEIKSSDFFREPLGSASLDVSDQQGNKVDLSCNITRSSDSQDIAPPPDLSLLSSSPLPLALSLSLECSVEQEDYEKLWRILAYYSETAVRLEREIMLSKAPALAYRYRQTAETDGYHHTGVRASVKARPQWLLQPAISIQLNRAQSTRERVHLIYSTRVSAPPDPTSYHSASSPSSHPWVLISTNQTSTALATAAGSKVELPCPLISSGNPKVHWILPDGSKHTSPSNSKAGRLWASASGLRLHKVQLSDAGIYYCIAHVGRDVDVLPLRLAVEESSVPHMGEQVGPPVTGFIGEPISLPCKASGSPVPRMSWMLQDGSIVRWGLATASGLTIQPNGSLLLPNPSQRDAGHYRCIVVNQYGSDSMSMQLELHSRHPRLLRTYLPRGPQSASGRSTKIRAPFHQMAEGSGYEKEDRERTTSNRNDPRLSQLTPNRSYSTGYPRRRLPMREGDLRRGGESASSTNQRRNRFENRRRVTTNKQRIDPQKWADILAKIRQKTAHTNSTQPITTGTPTAEEEGRGKGEDTGSHKEDADTEGEKVEGAKVEAEPEGSSVDDADLQGEHLQPITVFRDIQTHSETKTEPPSVENRADTHIQTEKAGPPTEIVTGPETWKERVTSNPLLLRNEIVREPTEQDEREANLNPSRIAPQKPWQGLSPNLVPNSRPQNPSNSRRRTGQRRRIINRPRGRPLTPPQLLPDPLNPKSHATPEPTTEQTVMLLRPSTTASPAILLTRSDHIRNGATLNSPSSKPASPPSLTSSSPRHIAVMTQSANSPDRGDSTPFNTPTPAPTPSATVIALTHVPDPDARTHARATQTRTETHTTLGKHVDRPSSDPNEELERNLLDVPYVSRSSTSLSPTIPPSTVSSAASTSTAAQITTLSSTLQSTNSAASSTSSISSATTTIIIAISSTTSTTVPVPITTTSFTPTTTSTAIPIPTAITTYSTAPTTSTGIAITAKTSPTTTRAATPSAPSTTTTTTAMTSASTAASSRESVGQVEARGKQVPGAPNQSRFPTDWKNPAANSIPDSHSSRPRWPSSPSLPAAPRAPVVRSRPRIANPHIRTVSFPAESTASLACEAQGEPKPSITWTKIATGAVMSIHSRAQRLEVLPNGTLVIQNVQLQDRGTYICSAYSFLGRDRILTTLEVWTRPPRMQLPIYREATVHQGGEVHLDCVANGVPTPLVSWVLPDRSVLTSTAPSARRINMDTNGTLHISVASHSDRGVYRCVASNSAGATSASVRVHVSSLPPVILLPREEHLLLSLGRPVYALCSARGAPPPTLRWRIPDGTVVRPSQFLHDNLFVLPNGTLHIRKVGPKDTGSYECTASNAVGADKRTVRVEIEEGAEGERRQGGARNEGAKTVVTGKTSSSSLSKGRTLFVPGHPSNPLSSPKLAPQSPLDSSRTSQLTPSHSHSSSYMHPPNSTVSIPRFATINQGKPSPLSPHSTAATNNSQVSPGITRAASSSSSDKSKASAVLRPLHISPFSKAHIVSSSPSLTTIHHGDHLQLHCSVTGNPPPIIIWRTPNRKLVDTHFSFDRRLKVYPNGTLSVQAATEKDAGDYLCIARNKVADDYRLLRVSVTIEPAKIEPKQPPNQTVLFGKPLKVDCQASGLPDPAVHWSLPDGTMVNSVLQGEDRGGRSRRLTVFDNGTLLVPAVGMGEEGEYTCFAENQGGQDTMKVKVKVMMTSPPTFSDDGRYHVIKVRQGATATIHCQASGDPAPTVTWFSPARRAIPQSLESGSYLERVVVVSNGTLEVRMAQKIDTGNYTCRASNAAGERSMVVGLEVEGPHYGLNNQVEGRRWTSNTGPGSGHSSRLGGSIKNAGTIQHGFTSGVTSKLDISNNSYNSYNDNNGRVRNIVPQRGINTATIVLNPALRRDSQDGINRPVNGIANQRGTSVISVALDKNSGINADNVGINRNGPDIRTNAGNAGNSPVRGFSAERNSGTDDNDVTAGKATYVENIRRDSGMTPGMSRRVFSSSVANKGAGTRTLRGNEFGRSSGVGVPNEHSRNSGSSSSTGVTASDGGRKNSTNTAVGRVTTVKQQAVKGQTVLLSCPSQGSPPPRLAWLLPGNGVLPAPYYGSRLTVHRNGSLELRGVRVSDGGTLVCVVRGDRDETRIQVELEVSESKEAARSPHRGSTMQENVGFTDAPDRPGASLDSAHSLSSRPVLPVRLHLKIPITQKPPHRGSPLVAAPHPVGPPPRSTGPRSEPAVTTQTAPLVRIINGETLRLPCTASQTLGYTQGSLSWTLPSGKVLSRGESGDSGRYSVHEDGTLTVPQASVFDRGTYTCRSASFDSSSVLAVTVPVIVVAYPPRITMGPSPVTYTRPGVAVELPCQTIATPRATVTWETPDLTRLRVTGQARIYGNRYLRPQGSLLIQNPTSRDTGFYRCTANNVIGVDSKTTYLHVM